MALFVKWLYICISNYEMWGILNGHGQQFQQYQQNEALTSQFISLDTNKTTTYVNRNPCFDLMYCRLKNVEGLNQLLRCQPPLGIKLNLQQ